MPSIYEIARQAQVSLATVSRALNPELCHKVKEETRNRILSICEKNYYRPRAAARAFASGRNSNISLILANLPHDFSSPIFSEFISGLTLGAQEYGYALNIHAIKYQSKQIEEDLRNYLLSGQADGYVISTSLLSRNNIELISHLSAPVLSLVHNKLPLSCSIPQIITDTTDSIASILRSLPSSWRGNSLFFELQNKNFHSNTKGKILQKTISRENLPEDFFQFLSPAIRYNSFPFDRYTSMCYASENFDILKKYRFIWCASDLTALGLCDALTQRGVIPGKDIMLAGFDNIERICNIPDPVMTTIDYNFENKGFLAAQTLIQSIRTGQKIKNKILVPTTVIRRKSFSTVNTCLAPAR